MRVVCAGLQKTGTTTFGAAMKRLGYTPYKASPNMRNLHIKGKDVTAGLEHYDAFHDHPFPFILDDLYRKFPFVVVLTIRRTPRIWIRSLKHQLNRRVSDASREYYFNKGKMKPDGELMDMYLRHNDHVHSWCEKNEVPMIELCWECGDGWNELALFLGVEALDEEFPWLNAS